MERTALEQAGDAIVDAVAAAANDAAKAARGAAGIALTATAVCSCCWKQGAALVVDEAEPHFFRIFVQL